MPSAPPDCRPTRARLGVLAFLCALAFVLYLDRLCISQAVEPIQREMSLTNTQVGWVLGTAAYWVWSRADPARHPAVNPEELDIIGTQGPAPLAPHEGIPWRAALGNRIIRTLGLIMVFAAFNSYLDFPWFPKYVQAA